MADTCVEINLDALCRRLSRERGREVGNNEAHAWLRGVGFNPVNDSWACDGEDAIGQLEPGEVISLTKNEEPL